LNGSIPDDKVEEIRRKADIASLIGEYVTLKKAGKNYLGLCPFHREKTPSFTVSPDKQMFYCFGCSEGGNVFSFLMKLNHLTFPEAVRHLARKVGVVIPEKGMSRAEKERYTLGEQIHKVNELAAGFFTRALQSPLGKGAREYLLQRGISDEAIGGFRLGFAPEGWQNLLDFLEKKGISPKLAEQAGLLVPKVGQGDRGYYDRFRGRLMIPIEDVNGHVIAFGGRVMGHGEPKYMNSPESAVYTKGSNLYGLAKTREAIREKGFAILVEGYFDLIALWNAGITNVVATLGTALTRAQVDLIRRYTIRVVAVFDPDEAGRKALARSLELFLAGNVHARAVILPDGHDPDDFVRSQGRGKMEALIAQAVPMVDYYIEQILGGRGTLEEDRDKLRAAVVFISRIEDAVERNLFVKKVSEKLNIDQEVLKTEVQRLHAAKPGEQAAQPRHYAKTEIDPLELSLIRMMLEYPARLSAVRESTVLDCFRTEELKALGRVLLDADGEGREIRDISTLVSGLAEGLFREKLLAVLVQESPYTEEMVDRQMVETIGRIRERSYKERRKSLTRRIAEAEKARDQGASTRLVAEWNRLILEEKMMGQST
jgi:DNA primase